MELSMKVIGRAPESGSYWRRWRRLQHTGNEVMGGLPYPQGVFRFATFEEADAWQNQYRLGRPEFRKTKT